MLVLFPSTDHCTSPSTLPQDWTALSLLVFSLCHLCTCQLLGSQSPTIFILSYSLPTEPTARRVTMCSARKYTSQIPAQRGWWQRRNRSEQSFLKSALEGKRGLKETPVCAHLVELHGRLSTREDRKSEPMLMLLMGTELPYWPWTPASDFYRGEM